jgi:hypothetical protein
VISGEIIIEASATIMVGVIFIISLREALKLPMSASSLDYVFYPMYFFAAAILFVLFGEDGYFAVLQCLLFRRYPCVLPLTSESFIGPTVAAGPFIFGLAGRICFLAGAFVLLFVVFRIQREARKRETEMVANLKRTIAELEEEVRKKEEPRAKGGRGLFDA